MQITKITEGANARTISKCKPVTSKDIQKEIDYWRAEKMLQKMLQKGLISEDELIKINKLNRQSFSPLYAQLMP